jgi:hypothetical protein
MVARAVVMSSMGIQDYGNRMIPRQDTFGMSTERSVAGVRVNIVSTPLEHIVSTPSEHIVSTPSEHILSTPSEELVSTPSEEFGSTSVSSA